MVYSIAWDEAVPADADNVSAGADNIRDDKVAVRERLDTLLTKGAAPVPPATITSVDRRLSTAVDPLWIIGDQVDLRGCTWRQYSTSTNTDNTIVATSFSPLPTAPLTLTLTPVSSQSLLEFHFVCIINYQRSSAAAHDALCRIQRTTGGGATVGPSAHGLVSLSPVVTSYPVVWSAPMHLFGTTTGLSGPHTFEVQAKKNLAADGMLILGTTATTLETIGAFFYCVEHV